MSGLHADSSAADRLVSRYVYSRDPRSLLGSNTLAVFGFGADAPSTLDDPRYLHVNLQSNQRPAPYEVWHSTSRVQAWRNGNVAGAHDGTVSFARIERDEGTDAVHDAARALYLDLVSRLLPSDYPHLLRVWNYLDAITEGDHDNERYRQFCVGRAAGLCAYPGPFPAATAIGRLDRRRVLQVYWLSARQPGTALENPRQVAAYHYPRQYGPKPPSFARAMLAAQAGTFPLMLSGTASVVGHASLHSDNLDAQLDESFRNLDVLLGTARSHDPSLPSSFGTHSLLKVYVRHAGHLQAAQRRLAEVLPPTAPRLLLQAEICRKDLLIEIDGMHAHA